jgi:hypothetical protein
MIYLTASGLTPGGSSTVHIYTQTIHRTAQSTQTVHRTAQSTQTIHRTTHFTNQKEPGPCFVFARYTFAFVLQLRKNMENYGKSTEIYYIYEYIYTCIFKHFFHLPAYCILGRFNQKETLNCASHFFAFSYLGGSLSVSLWGFLYSEEEGKHFGIKVGVYLPDYKAWHATTQYSTT